MSKELCVQILRLAFGWTERKSRKAIKQSIDSKAALNKFVEIVKAQGGNEKIVHNPALMKKAKYSVDIIAEESGKVYKIDGEELGNACKLLGGGRIHKTDKIFHEVGIDMHTCLNKIVKKGEKLATVFFNNKVGVEEILHKIQKAIKIKEKAPDTKYSLIYKIL